MKNRTLTLAAIAPALLLLTSCFDSSSSSGGNPAPVANDRSMAEGIITEGPGSDPGIPPQPTAPPEQGPLPYSSTRSHLTINDNGNYRPFRIKGMTLGAGLPGSQAGELKASREDYARWLQLMAANGFNTVRVYHLHFPVFYEALDAHNRNNPENPLYLLQGVLFPENADGSADLYDLTQELERRTLLAVDCIHGNCSVSVSANNEASGNFATDVSRWTLGWIIGREVYPNEILTTNNAHPAEQSFFGEAFRVRSGGAVEVWYARHLDRLVRYERDTYSTQRPVSVLTWPALDPITHPTENQRTSNQDSATFNPSLIEVVDAPGGQFATYHAYPYYPNFIGDDPGYRAFSDAEGPNAYLGYLTDLKAAHPDMPVFIGETGVPSSWGNAHFGYTGMNHGGHNEQEQGRVNARIMRSVESVDLAGAAFFGWMDEWWKRTWITDYFDQPAPSRARWHNVTTPEQNFGLLAFDPPSPDFSQFPPTPGQPPITTIQTAASNAFFHIRLELERDLNAQDDFVIGFDTYRNDLGESLLPGGTSTQNRNEFALRIRSGGSSAQYYVTQAYDLFGRRFNTSQPEQRYRSTASDGGEWHLMRWQNSGARSSDNGDFSAPATIHTIGELKVGGSDNATSHQAVTISNRRIDIRIPWTLLYFVDPTRHRVVHDDSNNPPGPVSTESSNGIALSLAANGSLLVETERFLWPQWSSAPATRERLKAGVEHFADTLRSLSNWPAN